MDFSKMSDEELDAFIANAEATQAPPVDQTSQTESFVRGTAQEATMGFADEIEAAVDTVMSGDISIDNYYKNKAIVNEEYRKAEEHNPAAYMAGQGTGLVGSMFIPGLNVAKGAKIGTYAAKGAISGAIVGAGKASEGETLEGAATGGAVGGVLGGVIGKTIDKLGSFAANKKATQMLGITTAKQNQLTQQHLNKVTGDTFLGAQRLKQKAASEMVDLPTYVDRLGNMPLIDTVEEGTKKVTSSGKKILNHALFGTTDDLLLDVSDNIKRLENVRNELLPDIDAKDAASTALSEIRTKFNDYLTNKTATPEAAKMAASLLDTVENSVTRTQSINKSAEKGIEVMSTIKDKITAKDLYNVRHSIDTYISDAAWSSVDQTAKKQLVSIARGVLNNSVDGLSDGADKIVREQLQHSYFLKDHFEKVVMNPKTKWGGVTDSIALATTIATGSPVAVMTKGMYNLATMSDASVAIPMMKTAQWMQKRGSGAARLATRLAVELDNPDQFGKIVEATAAQADLEDSPIERNYADIINKQNQILALVNNEVPQMYNQILQAFEEDNKEALLPLLDQVSKNPKFAKYFQQGLGFDGRLFSEEDKKTAINFIQGLNISMRQKAEKIKEIIEKGIAPTVEEETHPASLFAQKLQKPRM
jgi:hypothetical protein